MTAYLTDSIEPSELETGFDEGVFAAAKLYPANATINLSAGVTDMLQIDPLLCSVIQSWLPLAHLKTRRLNAMVLKSSSFIGPASVQWRGRCQPPAPVAY